MILGIENLMGDDSTGINEFIRREKLRDEIEKQVKEELKKSIVDHLNEKPSQETNDQIYTRDAFTSKTAVKKSNGYTQSKIYRKGVHPKDSFNPDKNANEETPFIIARQTYCILTKANPVTLIRFNL